jgi:DNA polymerase-3 subunit gamma/tau
MMLDYLKSVSKKEKFKIEDAALEIIAKLGGGSFRDSLSLLDQISTLSNEKITKEMVISAMGLPEDEKIEELLDDYASGDINKITNDLKELLNTGVKAETIVEELIAFIIEHPKTEFISLLSKLSEIKAPFAEAKLLVALTLSRATKKLEHDFSGDGSLAPVVTGLAPSSSVVTSGSPRKTCSQFPFDWDKFVKTVKEMNDAVAAQLKSVEYQANNDTLDIYPAKRVVKLILDKINNKKILIDAANGMKVIIHNVEERPEKKDTLISKISDIMGGEVQNDGGGNPF